MNKTEKMEHLLEDAADMMGRMLAWVPHPGDEINESVLDADIAIVDEWLNKIDKILREEEIPRRYLPRQRSQILR